MKDKIQIYDFNGHAFRMIVDENDEPWFVAKDVAEILEYSDAYEMTKKLDDDEKSNLSLAGLKRDVACSGENSQIDGLGPVIGGRGILLINESGLYSSILTSRKPEAKKFKRLVTHEILPSIRKNGYYQSRKTSLKSISPEMLKQCRLVSDKLAHEYLLDCGINPDWIKVEGSDDSPAEDPDIVKAFWETYRTIGYLADSQENPLNHSHHPETEIAINLEHFQRVCAEYELELLNVNELRRYLVKSQSRPLLCNKSVRSRLENRTRRCWVFKA